MEVMTTSIEVAGSSPVERAFEYTRHGGVLSPVVARKGDRAWVVSVAAMHDAGLLDQEIHRLNHAPRHRRGALRDGAPRHVPADGDRGRPRRQRVLRARRQVAAATRRVRLVEAGRWLDLGERVAGIPPAGGSHPDRGSRGRASSTTPTTRPTRASSGAGAYPDYLFHDQPGRTTWRGHRPARSSAADGDFTWDDARRSGARRDLARDARAGRRRSSTARATFHDDAGARTRRSARSSARLLRFDGRASAGSSDALAFHYFRDGLFAADQRGGDHARATARPGATAELDAKLARVVLDHASRAREAWIAGRRRQRDAGRPLPHRTRRRPRHRRRHHRRARDPRLPRAAVAVLRRDAARALRRPTRPRTERRARGVDARLAGAAAGAVHRPDPLVHAPSLRAEPEPAVAALRRSIEARRRGAPEADLVRARRAAAAPRIGARARDRAAPPRSSAAAP